MNPIGRSELHESWRLGAEEFNAGRYWHAHEHWEHGWVGLPLPEKRYVQALIQGAAVFHLLEKGRPGPAESLCRRALHHFEHSVPGATRVEIPGIRELLAEIQAGLAGGKARTVEWLARAHALRAGLC